MLVKGELALSYRGSSATLWLTSPSAIASPDLPAYMSVMITFVDILLYVLLAVVFVVLCLGVFSLFKGGEFGRSWSNKLMRARVAIQFVAILVLVAGFWLKNQMGA